jgi:Mrp family chromosome partitioning ATPase
MEPIDYVSALRRSWRLLVALGILFAVIAVLIPVKSTVVHTTNYGFPWRASTLVGAPPGGGGSALTGGVTAGQIVFYSTSSGTKQTTAEDESDSLGIPASVIPSLLTSAIVPPVPGSLKRIPANEVLLTAAGSSSAGAVELVNDYAQEVDATLSSQPSLRRGSSGTTGNTGYTVIQPAVQATLLPSTIIVSPGPMGSRKIRLLVGLAVGVVLGAGIVLLRELLNQRIRSAARAESTFDYPVVAEIPAVTGADGAPGHALVVAADPASPAAESYRMLRMSVLFERLAPAPVTTSPFDYLLQGGDANLPEAVAPAEELPLPGPGARKVVLVVSARAEPTRPQVAANLAAVYGEAGQRVVVVSTADVEAGRLRGPGEYSPGEIGPEDVEARLEASNVEHLFRLTLRHFVDNSSQLVNRAPMVLDAARTVADVVIVETMSLLAVHHAEALAHAVDVVLVVGECGSTTYDDARKVGDLLRRINAPVLGVVLTNVRADGRAPSGPQSRSVGGAPAIEDSGDPAELGLSAAGTSATHTQA